MNLNSLIQEIKRDNKMPTDEILSILAESMEQEEETSHVFKRLYKRAYGEHLSHETARDWVHSMSVTDESGRANGEKWTLEQTTEVGNKMNVNWQKMNKYEWYAVMNAFYSDFYRTAKKYELADVPDFFADLVLDYFCYDEDAKGKSVFCYYFDHVA